MLFNLVIVVFDKKYYGYNNIVVECFEYIMLYQYKFISGIWNLYLMLLL